MKGREPGQRLVDGFLGFSFFDPGNDGTLDSCGNANATMIPGMAFLLAALVALVEPNDGNRWNLTDEVDIGSLW